MLIAAALKEKNGGEKAAAVFLLSYIRQRLMASIGENTYNLESSDHEN